MWPGSLQFQHRDLVVHSDAMCLAKNFEAYVRTEMPMRKKISGCLPSLSTSLTCLLFLLSLFFFFLFIYIVCVPSHQEVMKMTNIKSVYVCVCVFLHTKKFKSKV